MKLITEIKIAILSYPKAFHLITKFKLIKYVVALVLLILIFVLPILMIDGMASFISAFIPYFNGEKYTEIGVSFLASISGFFLLIFLTPIFSIVSEEVHNKLTGKKNPFSIKQLVQNILRGIKITGRNLLYEYVAIVFVIVGLNFFSENWLFSVLSRLLIFMITSYFYGFSIMDYALENKQLNYKESIKYVRTHAGYAIGLGAVYYFVISVNNIELFQNIFGRLNTYWSSFAEAIIAFIGVIAANIVLNNQKKIKKTI